MEQLQAKRLELEAKIAKGGGQVEEITVGRDPSNDIVIDAPMVSGFHCKLFRLPSGDGYQIEDRGSTNHTYLNSRENQINPGGEGQRRRRRHPLLR